MTIITKKFIKNVLILSAILIIVFNIGENLINANTSEQMPELTSNKTSFRGEDNSILGTSGVAITTNVGTRFKQKQELPVTIFTEVMSVEEMMNDTKKVEQELIGQNMVVIQEYKNVLKTDVKKLLTNSYNKASLLNAYIDQLKFRYTNGVKNAQLLGRQRDVLLGIMNTADANTEILKGKMSSDFVGNDASASVENIDEYLKIKKEYYFAKTYVIYINQFIAQYNFLNDHNKNLLDILINNKEALIKDTYLVIPDSGGIESLKEFNLIYDETEIKNK